MGLLGQLNLIDDVDLTICAFFMPKKGETSLSAKRIKQLNTIKEVATMKFDTNLILGVLVGLIVALHYHVALTTYLPIFMILTVLMVIRLIHR